jgi:hypothetical protein
MLALAHAPAAGAQDVEAARLHFETGTRAFETGDYELSVSEFQAAYDITGHPDILFNIYSAAERAGRLEIAADALDRHLREAEVDPEQRASASSSASAGCASASPRPRATRRRRTPTPRIFPTHSLPSRRPAARSARSPTS